MERATAHFMIMFGILNTCQCNSYIIISIEHSSHLQSVLQLIKGACIAQHHSIT